MPTEAAGGTGPALRDGRSDPDRPTGNTLPEANGSTAVTEDMQSIREKAELYDKYISSYKEVQRKRNEACLALEEKAAQTRELLLRLLSLEDDLERAVEYAELGRNFEAVLAGLRPVLAKLGAILASQGLERIETDGAPFDPELHQCLDEPQPEDVESGTLKVGRELRKGYREGDTVLRKAIVEVE